MSQVSEMDFSKIKLLVMDVDGVMTDGTVIINSDGSEGKNFSIVDGHGIKLRAYLGRVRCGVDGRRQHTRTHPGHIHRHIRAC